MPDARHWPGLQVRRRTVQATSGQADGQTNCPGQPGYSQAESVQPGRAESGRAEPAVAAGATTAAAAACAAGCAAGCKAPGLAPEAATATTKAAAVATEASAVA